MVKNNKIIIGILFIIGLFAVVYGAGFHIADEILSGTFKGNYTFDGDVNFVNGNVGIGTINPEDKLEIGNGNLKFDLENGIKWTNVDGTDFKSLRLRATHTYNQGSDNDLELDSRLNILYPGAELSIIDVSGYSTSNQGGGIRLRGTYTVTGASDYAYIKSEKANTIYADRKANLKFQINSGSGLSNAMFIQYDGNVGIGTITPGTKLQIMDNLGVTFGEKRIASFLRTGGAGDAGLWLGYYADGSNPTGGYMRSTNNLPLFLGTTNKNQALTILNNGNVGIGIENPQSKLHVIGDTQFNGDIYGGLYGGTRGIWRFSSADPNYGIFYTEASPDVISFSPQGGGTTSPTMVIAGNNVGIGTSSPSYKLDVNGNLRAYGITDSSDIRLKENITNVINTLDKVTKLQAVNYNWIDKNISEELQLGLIAQDVELVFPQTVSTDEDGYKSIAYGKLSAVLIEAMKELKEDNDNKQTQIDELKIQNNKKDEEIRLLKTAFCNKFPEETFCN